MLKFDCPGGLKLVNFWKILVSAQLSPISSVDSLQTSYMCVRGS